ncbi:profilin-2-like [Schistocerca gregaria]|uniref:profilin-2-like n=1 Tax=Schistocerca gregaria TaxID=7010 RepID=UPI00211E74E1|nr:profilin-2-like [Schistocerca gregaria]
MSWTDYIKNLTNTGHVDKAAIVGPNGSIWAASNGWNITSSEITNIVCNWPNFSSSGIKLAGTKFMFIRGDDHVVLGRDKATGICIGKTKQAFVIGFHNDKQYIGNCNKEVQKIVDYLTEQGY